MRIPYMYENSIYVPESEELQKCLPDGVIVLPFGLHFTEIQNKHLDQVTSDVMLSIQYILEEKFSRESICLPETEEIVKIGLVLIEL